MNINEAPIAVNFTHAQVPEVFENTTIGSIIGTLVAVDSDANQALAFTLDGDSQGEFSLSPSSLQCQSITHDGNQTRCTITLLLSKTLNYELNSKRFITVRVTDNHGLFYVQKFAINVLDCNDAPTNIFLSGGISAVVYENINGSFVGELETSDEDKSQNWSYSVLDDFENLFKVIGNNIYVNTALHLNYEAKSSYILGVKSVDSGVPPYDISRNFTIVVVDINEAPTKITPSSTTIFENSPPGTIIANLTVDDPDNLAIPRQSHSCIVVGQNKVTIDSGRLVNSVVLDFEKTPYVNISIQCTDSGTPSLKYTQDFTVSVKDKNEAPSDIVLSSLSVLENQESGVIGKLKCSAF